MRSTITTRGQTVIPAEIRKRFHLDPSRQLEWIGEDGNIKVLPVAEDPIEAFRGRGKGGSTTRLMNERRRDRH
ncbi:AbrB/MazE/SpoVT family DNA-binding domain-containing protein [Desulfobulbus alkaliphilus]|uniref:AbrB/MazE/SpoVT family DNA-binding domain-containing protein n=1 Tax=Desulfobulbus alkaliphilus TaxID=869814 RepID=UPI001963642F|nr:hypothetical protein [Desulfobulbus alkaliphilus]MBM9535472.1 hypothetical protein [Desulfobulbus alkaliphilus]